MKKKQTFRYFLTGCMVLFLATSVLYGLVGCSDKDTEKRPHITVSIETLRFVVEYLAGNRFELNTLTPEGANPENYQLTTQQIKNLNHSIAYIRIGTLGFEHSQLRKMQSISPHLFIVSASDGVAPLAYCDQCCESPDGDPHTWTSPTNMKYIASNICDALSVLDKENKIGYEKRLTELQAHIDSLDTQIREKLQQVEHRSFLINHPSLAYFAHDYDLHQIPIDNNEHLSKEEIVAKTVEQCRKQQVKLVFIQTQHDGSIAQEVARLLDIPVVEIDPISYRWSEQLLHIADAFTH